MPALLWEALPFSSFHIRHIDLQRQNSDGEVLQQLKGYADYSEQGLSLALKEDAYLKGLQLKLEMDKKNGVRAALYEGKVAIAQIKSILHQTPGEFSVDGTSDIKLAPFYKLLKAWVKMPDQKLEGALHGSWQLVLPAHQSTKKPLWQQIDASTAMQLDFSLHRSDFGVARGKVHLDMILKQGRLGWAIADSSQISFGDKQPTSVNMSGLSGSFERTKSAWRAVIAENSVVRVKHLRTSGMVIPFVSIQTNAPVTLVSDRVSSSNQKALLLQQLQLKAAMGLNFGFRRSDIGSGKGRVNMNLIYHQGAGTWSFDKGSSLRLSNKPMTAMGLSGLRGTFSVIESAGGTVWGATVAKNSALQLKNVRVNDILMSHIKIKAGSAIAITSKQKSSIQLVKKAVLTAVLPTLQQQKNSIAIRELMFSMHRGSLLTPSGSFMVSGVKVISDNITFPESRISGTYKLTAQQLSLVGDVISQTGEIHLDWKLNHHMRQQKGMLSFAMKPLAFGANSLEISSLIQHLDDTSIDNGSLDFNGMLQWDKGGHNKNLSLRSQCILNLSGLQGHYQKNLFADLNGQILLRSDAHGLIMEPSTISMGSLYAAVPVTDIKMRAGFRYPFNDMASVDIDGFQAKALGGSITSDHIALDLAKASNPFIVQLEHIDAEQLAKIRQQKGLLVQGYLNGTLPFNWTRDGLKMTAGELHVTQAGGLIRYQAKESVRNLAGRGKATQMVLDILSDFHYKQMNVGADYQPDGALDLRIHLKGNNPAYERGRSVAFNFNIEENILQLLQGLRMSGRLSKALEKKVQKTLQKE